MTASRGNQGSLRSKILEVLANAQGRASGMSHRPGPRSGYVSDWRENLLPLATPDLFETDLQSGSGSELESSHGRPAKFAACHSSSALAVNTFAPWKRTLQHLHLAGEHEFESMTFERKIPTGLPNAMPPNLDLVLESTKTVFAVESKFTEYLTAKPAQFSVRYDSLIDRLFEPGPLVAYRELKADPKRYQMLDAAQLIKHYLGLRNVYANKKTTLLYLFWEPVNWKDYDVFSQHRREVETFASRFSKSRVRFRSMSYLDVWRSWRCSVEPVWLSGHLDLLERRYLVSV